MEIQPDEFEQIRPFNDIFVQRNPRYGIRIKGRWRTRQKPLADPAIFAHLQKKYTIGVLGQWYPSYAVLDVDDRSLEFVENLRADLSLSETNSMLVASESADSYHIYLRPRVNDKPADILKMNRALKSFARSRGIEVFPQQNKVIRMAFGEHSEMLDYEYRNLKTWQEKLYYFQKLDDFDLSTISGQQFELPWAVKSTPLTAEHSRAGGWYEQGAELFASGLQATGTRHESQAKVVYYLWRRNVPLNETIRQTWQWIRKHHNGFSKDIERFPARVKDEIQRQADHIYTTYKWAESYPDSTHNNFNGFITKPDIETIFKICQGSIPRSRFLFHIVKYCYPRRHRPFIQVHRDLLRSWAASRTVTRYLNEFTEMNIIQRWSSYSVGRFSKSLKLDWDYKPDGAVLYNMRSIDTFDDTIRMVFKPKPGDFRGLLTGSGATRTAAINAVTRIFGGVTNDST